jgi:hypothetical protein
LLLNQFACLHLGMFPKKFLRLLFLHICTCEHIYMSKCLHV